jgi:hypothetical protein
MTRDPDLIGLVEAYLDDFEGSTPLPDVARDEIRARLPSTPQRPAWWPAWRFSEPSTMLRYAMGAAAAAVILVIVGITALGGSGDSNVGGPGDTAGPTPSPSPATNLPPSGVPLEPGRYMLQVVGNRMTATLAVTEGWDSQGWYIERPEDGVQLTVWKVGAVYLDACNGPDAGFVLAHEMSVDELVMALDDQVSTDLSEPRDVVVGGYEGVRVELGTSEEVDPSACSGGSLYAWIGDGTRSHSGNDALWILDVDGDTVLVLAAYELGDPAAEAAAQEVVDTIGFGEA